MKKYLVLFLVFAATQAVFSQKAKITFNGDTAVVDGKPFVILAKKGGLSADLKVKSLNGTALINFNFQEYDNPNKINSGNPKGRVTYFEITFLDATGGKCEADVFSSKKAITKLLLEEELIAGNELNPTSVKNFIAIRGTKFSEEKAALNGPKVIIIEK